MTIPPYRRHRRLFSALESELNVDRVYRENRDSNEVGIFDNLYQGIQTRIEEDKVKEESEANTDIPEDTSVDQTDDSQDQSTDNASGESTDDAQTDKTEESPDTENKVETKEPTDDNKEKDKEDAAKSEDKNEDEDKAALESLLNDHQIALENFLSLESDFYSNHKYASKAVDALSYMKDVGFKYGPILLKHVYKGVIVALNLIFKGIINSAVLINRLAVKYRQSYETSKERIAELRQAIELINENNVEPPETEDNYRNVDIIRKLSSRENVDFLSLSKEVLKFNTSIYDFSMKEMTTNVNATNGLIQMAMSSKVSTPNTLMVESSSMPGLIPKRIPGYDFSDAYIESYVYNRVLPGNILFIGHFPKKSLKSREDILEAYKDAKVFMGFDEEHFVSNESVGYMSVEDISNYLDNLDQLCDIGLKENEKLDGILKAKRHLKIKLSLYLKYLATAKDKVSIEDSLAEYIGLKIKYFDNVYIKGSSAVYEYNTQYIASALTYLSACLKRYA